LHSAGRIKSADEVIDLRPLLLLVSAEKLVHCRVPNRQDIDHLARFVDFVNDPVHVTFRSNKQMPKPSFRPCALGGYGAAAWRALKGMDGRLKPIEPTGSLRRIVRRDSLIEVI